LEFLKKRIEGGERLTGDLSDFIKFQYLGISINYTINKIILGFYLRKSTVCQRKRVF
jgi:hypothetical protein